MTQTAVPVRVIDGAFDIASGRARQSGRGDRWSTTVGLGPIEDPGTAEDHVLTYSIGKDRAGGRPLHATVTLLEGDTPLVQYEHRDVQPGDTPVRRAIPPEVAAQIKDYNNLRVRIDFERGAP